MNVSSLVNDVLKALTLAFNNSIKSAANAALFEDAIFSMIPNNLLLSDLLPEMKQRAGASV
ncbi:MAG: hypothetical protein ACLQPD_12820 [Desulfomonilaceae bacterium]